MSLVDIKYCPKGHTFITKLERKIYCKKCHKIYYEYHYKGFSSDRERKTWESLMDQCMVD